MRKKIGGKKAKVSNGTSTGGMLMRRAKTLFTVLCLFLVIFGSLSYLAFLRVNSLLAPVSHQLTSKGVIPYNSSTADCSNTTMMICQKRYCFRLTPVQRIYQKPRLVGICENSMNMEDHANPAGRALGGDCDLPFPKVLR